MLATKTSTITTNTLGSCVVNTPAEYLTRPSIVYGITILASSPLKRSTILLTSDIRKGSNSLATLLPVARGDTPCPGTKTSDCCCTTTAPASKSCSAAHPLSSASAASNLSFSNLSVSLALCNQSTLITACLRSSCSYNSSCLFFSLAAFLFALSLRNLQNPIFLPSFFDSFLLFAQANLNPINNSSNTHSLSSRPSTVESVTTFSIKPLACSIHSTITSSSSKGSNNCCIPA